MANWLDKYNLRPTFFNIINSEKIMQEHNKEKEPPQIDNAAYNQGYEDAKLGYRFIENPYDFYNERLQWFSWNEGFLQLERIIL